MAELLVGALPGDPPVVEDHDVVDLVERVYLVGERAPSTAPSHVIRSARP